MLELFRKLERRKQAISRFSATRPKPKIGAGFSQYQTDPVGYATDVLKVFWWEKQVQVARALVNNTKVFVKASHSIGKTHLAGGLISWHFDCFDPSITKTTAPAARQVNQLTWKEVRLQRRGRGMLPKAPRIEAYLPNGDFDPGHFAAGFTARNADAFQGDHDESLLIIFEEAVGIDEQFWTASEGMLSSGRLNRWLAIMNPTDTASTAYQQEIAGDWHVIAISALEHPNVLAEATGQAKPFPKAISLSWVEERIQKWCTPIEAADARAGDFCWPLELIDVHLRALKPEDGEKIEILEMERKSLVDYWESQNRPMQHYRPGALFESRALGRWPSQATGAVWSQAAWESAIMFRQALAEEAAQSPVEIGCDVARYGDDFTVIHVRRGPVSLHHESHNGWSTAQTAGRLKMLAAEFGQISGQEARKVLVKVDDDGVGGGVIDQKEDYNFSGLSAASTAIEAEGYPNRRSEMWFATFERADEGRLDLSRLPERVLNEIRRQMMAPTWHQDSKGRRVVEEKDKTKKRIKRSPDDADAVNLAYAPAKTPWIISAY